MVDTIPFRLNAELRTEFWTSLNEFYRSGKFTDLEIVCSDFQMISCHKIVMASLSETIGDLILMNNDDDEAATVLIPDYPLDKVKTFVDSVYTFLATNNEEVGTLLGVSEEIAKLFRVRTSPMIKSLSKYCCVNEPMVKIEPGFETEEENDDSKSFLGSVPANEEEEEYQEQEKKPSTVTRKKKKPKKRKTQRNNVDDDEFYAKSDWGMPKKKSRKVMTFEDIVDVHDIEERKKIAKVLSEANSSIDVEFLPTPLDVSSEFNAYTNENAHFRALVGVVRSAESPGLYLAKPLAWSFPNAEDLESQFNAVFDAFRHVFGFSDGDICYTGHMYARQGLWMKNNSRRVRQKLKNKYAELDAQQAQELMEQQDINEAIRRYPMKPFVPIESKMSARLVLNPILEPSSLEGIAYLSWTAGGMGVEAKLVHVTEEQREDDSKDCVRALFDIWCLGRKQRIPKSMFLCNKFDELIDIMETFYIVRDFIEPGSDQKPVLDDQKLLPLPQEWRPVSKKEKPLRPKEEQCHVCGKVFKCVTSEERSRFSSHKRMHTIQRKTTIVKPNYIGGFICCEERFPDRPTITEHVKTYHTDDKYINCDSCSFLGTIIGVVKHKEVSHIRMDIDKNLCVCETCGKVLPSKGNLASHRMIHRIYHCNICGEDIVSNNAFATHKKNVHNIAMEKPRYPCEICGKDFPKKVTLKHHFIRKHMDEKDHPFHCEECGRGFPSKYSLTSHKMMAHIKARPYKCRYECGADYNDQASRGTHEFKKHGAKFPDQRLVKKKLAIIE